MTEELLERLIEVVNDLRSPTLTDWLLAAVPGLALVVTWLLWWRDRRTLLGEIETGRQREARAVQPTVFVVTDEHKVGTLLLGKKRRAETWAYSRVRLHNLGPGTGSDIRVRPVFVDGGVDVDWLGASTPLGSGESSTELFLLYGKEERVLAGYEVSCTDSFGRRYVCSTIGG